MRERLPYDELCPSQVDLARPQGKVCEAAPIGLNPTRKSEHSHAFHPAIQRHAAHEMAAQVRAKVASGDYASESEVIREGLRALQARDRAFDTWLSGEAAKAYDAIQVDPSRGRSSQDVRATLSAEHERATKA